MKRVLLAVIVLVTAIFLIMHFFLMPAYQKAQADKAVYNFIAASVEADHDLRKTVVVASDHAILANGRHLFPGDAEVMGDRYTIKRFDHEISEGKIYYYIDYYFPQNKRSYAMYLMMIQGDDGKWRSSSLTGISNLEMSAVIDGHEDEGVLVHHYEERNQ
jgi:hypothetical protein